MCTSIWIYHKSSFDMPKGVVTGMYVPILPSLAQELRTHLGTDLSLSVDSASKKASSR